MTDQKPIKPLHKLRWPAFAFSLIVLATLSACNKTLLHANDARSPFDRYNQTRSQHAPPFLTDEFGRRTPSLRDRLVKSDE